MARDWIKEVPLDQLDPAKDYFVCRTWKWGGADGESMTHRDFYSTWGNGTAAWSGKPGIAERFPGNDKLRDYIERFEANNKTAIHQWPRGTRIVALEVPADADKRWKRRKVVGK